MSKDFFDLERKCGEEPAGREGPQHNNTRQQKWILRLNPSACLTFMNDACRRTFGLKPGEHFGAKDLPFILEEDLLVLQNALRQSNPRRPAEKVDLRVVVPGGGTEKRTWIKNAVFEENGSLKECWLITEYSPPAGNLAPRPLCLEMGNPAPETRAAAFALFELISIEPGYSPQFRMIEADLAFEELKGISIEALLGRRLSEVLPGLESDWLDMLKRVVFHGEGARFRYFFRAVRKYLEVTAYRFATKQMAMRLAEYRGPISGEEMMCLSVDSFKTIIEGVAEGIVIAYEFSEPCVFANRRAGRLSGYGVQELLRIAPARFLLEVQEPKFQLNAHASQHTDWKEKGVETELIRKDGDIWPADVWVSTLCWQGRPVKIILFSEAPCRGIKSESPAAGDEPVNNGSRQYAHHREATSRMLALKQAELDRYKTNLERVNRELVHTNKALSVMARNIDRKGQQMVQQIIRAVTSKIMPALEELESVNLSDKFRVQIDVIRSHLEELTSGTTMGSGVAAALSKSELRVAILIRNGYNTIEISRLLHLSDLTVKTHRKNIRKKLQIGNSKINLGSYLKMRLGKPKFVLSPRIKERLDKTGSTPR
jgi:PAS domain-containing protein/DNA-binding CsgD family transcriptional regulator